jgi:hypothetical protein
MLLSNANFINSMKNFDKNNIDQKLRAKIKKIFDENPTLNEENAKKVSKAAACLFNWVKAVYEYSVIFSKIEKNPKEDINGPKTNEEEEKINKHKDDNPKKESQEEDKPDELLENAFKKMELFLDKPSISELKSYKKPPQQIELTMKCVCILLKKAT